MRKILFIVIIIIIGLSFLLKYLIIGRELKISFITEQKHSNETIADSYGLNYHEWFIINSNLQVINLEKKGYIVPNINFNKNFLIISRYKISKLYRKAGCNECLGVPDGHAIFDKENSDKDFYYFYLMPKVWLSQGVG